jgi:hypothetical protein
VAIESLFRNRTPSATLFHDGAPDPDAPARLLDADKVGLGERPRYRIASRRHHSVPIWMEVHSMSQWPVFLNYRRDDDPGYAQALYLLLAAEFQVFMDIEGQIQPGDDFVDAIDRQVASCAIMLAVIGPRWADLLKTRENHSADFVVREIEAAFKHKTRIVPVLVGRASMPEERILPEPIRALARRQAVVLRPERFRADCKSLTEALTKVTRDMGADIIREAAAIPDFTEKLGHLLAQARVKLSKPYAELAASPVDPDLIRTVMGTPVPASKPGRGDSRG